MSAAAPQLGHEHREGARTSGLGVVGAARRRSSASSAAASRPRVVALALLGTPLFAVMGGASELAWLTHPDAEQQLLRYIAPNVLDERFAGSPILITIPLFTFVGYLHGRVEDARAPRARGDGARSAGCPAASRSCASSRARSSRSSPAAAASPSSPSAACSIPALRQEGYSEKFSLGLVTTGGSLGLLLPYSLPLLVYALVAGIDFQLAFKAVLAPGVLVLVLFVGVRRVRRHQGEDPAHSRSTLKEALAATWALKWELGISVLILVVGLKTGLTAIDEGAGLVALYTLVHRGASSTRTSRSRRTSSRIAKASMALAGAVILILAMANALINYVVDEHIPDHVLECMLKLGLDKTWQFLIVMNVFLLVLGMIMDGFSAILVAVPLILPFAAHFGLGPFHVAMMFLLNLELAFCVPAARAEPLHLELPLQSARGEPLSADLAVRRHLLASLLVITYVPRISTLLVLDDIAAARAKAAKQNAPPARGVAARVRAGRSEQPDAVHRRRPEEVSARSEHDDRAARRGRGRGGDRAVHG